MEKRNSEADPWLVDIGTHRLHIHCSGDGLPSVILDAGLNDGYRSWEMIQEAIAEHTRVCSYSRAGRGRSEPGPSPRTSRRIVEELHTLLKNADIKPPYVLVGHSFGGMNMRVFAHRYPSEVAGLVLIDTPHEHHRTRLLDRLPAESVDDTASVRAFRASWSRPNPEGVDWLTSTAEVAVCTSLGDLPLVVITASMAGRLPSYARHNPELPHTIASLNELVWQELQDELTRLSSGSVHIIAETGHYVHREQPGVVIDAVCALVDHLRQDPRGRLWQPSGL